MDDSVRTEDDIEWAVKQLRNNRSRVLLGMRAGHLKRWIATERKAKKDKETSEKEEAETTTERERTDISAAQKETESENWMRVVYLVQSAFREGKLAEEETWQAVILIPKGKKYYLPHHLHEANAPVVLLSLGNQDHRLPGCFLRKLPLPERQLYEVHDPCPVVGLRLLLRR